MSRRTPMVCRQPGCPNLRPCPNPGHEPQPWQGSTRRRRLPADWPARRAAILHRDPTCRIRFADICTITSTDVDHVTRGDDHSLTNLQGACGPCHRRKTAAEAADARRRSRG